jgi:N-acetylglutamate synthase-like GNAT family acetyltransferase
LKLLRPLEVEGILVRRSRELLEQEIEQFVVLEHDHRIVGCAALYPFPDEVAAELAGLAVETQSRDRGYGEAILHHMISVAKAQGMKKLFVLTTRTAHWFIERCITFSENRKCLSGKFSARLLDIQSRILVNSDKDRRVLSVLFAMPCHVQYIAQYIVKLGVYGNSSQ